MHQHGEFHTLPKKTRAQAAQRLVAEREAELDGLIGKYVDDYGWDAFDRDYVTEEIPADACADIEIYAGIRDHVGGTPSLRETMLVFSLQYCP